MHAKPGDNPSIPIQLIDNRQDRGMELHFDGQRVVIRLGVNDDAQEVYVQTEEIYLDGERIKAVARWFKKAAEGIDFDPIILGM